MPDGGRCTLIKKSLRRGGEVMIPQGEDIQAILKLSLYAPEKRERRLYYKIFLESDEKITTKLLFPSSYKGGRMLSLESSLCLMLGSSCGGGE